MTQCHFETDCGSAHGVRIGLNQKHPVRGEGERDRLYPPYPHVISLKDLLSEIRGSPSKDLPQSHDCAACELCPGALRVIQKVLTHKLFAWLIIHPGAAVISHVACTCSRYHLDAYIIWMRTWRRRCVGLARIHMHTTATIAAPAGVTAAADHALGFIMGQPVSVPSASFMPPFIPSSSSSMPSFVVSFSYSTAD